MSSRLSAVSSAVALAKAEALPVPSEAEGAKAGANIPRHCERTSPVIASEAKQSLFL